MVLDIIKGEMSPGIYPGYYLKTLLRHILIHTRQSPFAFQRASGHSRNECAKSDVFCITMKLGEKFS